MTTHTQTPSHHHTDSRTPAVLRRIAGWCHRRHWVATACWLLAFAGLTVTSQQAGSAFYDDTSLPGTESQRVADIYAEHAPSQAGDSMFLVVNRRDGVKTKDARQNVRALLEELSAMDHVAAVSDPYREPGAVSGDGEYAYVTVTLDDKTSDIPPEDVRALVETARDASAEGLRVAAGGDPVRATEEGGGGPAEGAGLLAALVILVLMFGSVLAASLPVLTAIFAVGSTLAVVSLLSHLVTVASYTAPLMMLVGLGVGVDYALLVFVRYRAELLAGRDNQAATVAALDTAGRAVIFAGTTVIVALLGLFLIGVGSLQGVALAVALTVLVTMVAAITLLPALLGIFGRRIEVRVRRRASAREPRGSRRWERWARLVQRRPWAMLLTGTFLLLALCLPALDMRLGFADAGTEAPSSSSRQAYEAVAAGFGPGFNGPLVLLSSGGDPTAPDELQETLQTTPGIAELTPAQPLGDSAYSVQLAFPTTAPQDQETAELVERLREDVLPTLRQRTGAEYLVGGTTAATIDFSNTVGDRLPAFVLIVVGLSAVLLMAVFRSVLIPVKAALLNLFTIGSSLGVITYVFQHGNMGAQPGPIEAFVPVMIFAIVFGLSMDYEVFLVSRMHEEWRATGDPEHSIRHGLVTTGTVITAAAAIMVVVFGAFLFSGDRMLQQFGLGLAVAVLIDAVVVRSLLVPSIMHLLGSKAWWLPGRLAAVLPEIPLEPTGPAHRERNNR